MGRPIKVDMNTSLATRGRFVRVCIEVDLNKPLVGQFRLDGKVCKVKYEGLHTICFACGHFGHTQDTCPIVVAQHIEASAGDSSLTANGTEGGAHPNFGKNTIWGSGW